MVKLYVNLIRHGKRVVEQVPEVWREEVRLRCIEEGLIEETDEISES